MSRKAEPGIWPERLAEPDLLLRWQPREEDDAELQVANAASWPADRKNSVKDSQPCWV
jgi:hypothetical protein